MRTFNSWGPCAFIEY